MKEVRIIGISVYDRIKEAGFIQKLMTEYSPIIKTRLGFHEVSSEKCSRQGFIVIELTGDVAQWNKFESDVKEIGGVEIQKMSFFEN